MDRAGVEHAGHLRDAAPEARQPPRPRHGRIAPAQTGQTNSVLVKRVTCALLVKCAGYWSKDTAPEARQPPHPRHGRIPPAQTNWSNGFNQLVKRA